MNGNTFRNRLLASSVIAGAAFAVVAAPAVAQEDDEAVQETVIVTGSRIAKQDFVSNSPIATVDSETFELTGSVNTEDVLNTLPQAIPGFDRSSNNPGDGTATANLRGLGSARTLVLVDGRRMVPSRSDGVVDLNNIPAAMIERVEVITGGASAVYGSDAMAGVVNFILKDDFEGFEANLGYEQTVEYGDAEYFTADVTWGANFDGGRGNVTTNFSFTDRKDVFASDRDFARVIPGGGGSSGVPDGHSFNTFDFTALGQATDLANCPEGTALNTAGTGCVGQAIFAGPNGIRPWINGGANSDRYNYAPVNYLQLPQERFSTTTLARYEITEDMELYGRFTGSFNQVPQQLAPTPAFTSITTATDNPFLSAAAQAALAQLDTDGDGSVSTFIGRRLEETGGRISNDDRFAFQFQVGATGTIADSFDYDVYFQKGRSQNNNDLNGDVSLTRYLDAVNVTDDGNGNPVCVSGNASCVPLNIFGQGNISDAAADYITLGINAKSEYNQTVFGATITGDTEGFVSLPGGPIGWAVGTEYREEEFDFRPSDALAQGALLGFNSAPPVSGGFDVYDVFAEFYAPILSGVAGAELLAVEGAIRISDYSTVGTTEAYKLGGEWSPVDGLRFRALYNTAVRAPNVSELFTPQSNGFPGASDPCSTTNNPVASGIQALCAATGVPAAQIGDSGTGPANPAFYQQRNDQVEGLFNGVNPNLAQEEAETLTVGAVFEPNMIDGLTVAVDYYNIEITDYITVLGGGAQGVFDQCYGTTFNAAQDPNNSFCLALNRGASGESNPILPNANSGFLETSGIDIAVNYGFETSIVPGAFTVGYQGLVLDKWDFQASSATDVRSCKGQYGNFCDDPVADYKHLATFGWSDGPYSAQLRWEHIGAVDADDGTSPSLDAANYFNLNGSWDINDNLRLSGGIDNLFDEEPSVQLGGNAEQANTFPSTYDLFGRTAYVNAKIRF
ncbi:MAG: TonB-dependent receptor [Henriciella sp.]|nr:TonB-dependent receptor [Henriciella sp.]